MRSTRDAEGADILARLLESVVASCRRLAMVRAVALVGSRAAGRAGPDSDVDLVLLVSDKESFLAQEVWRQVVPADGRLVRAREWGVVTERRVRLASGLEVELGIAGLAWAATEPLDAGTWRVARDGLRILYDPDGLLVALVAAVARRAVPG